MDRDAERVETPDLDSLGHKQSASKSWTARELYQMLGIEEEAGYDAPFTTFTWERWLEMQTMLIQDCARFQRAVEQREVRLMAMIVLEIQEVAMEFFKEACAWIAADIAAGARDSQSR